MKSAVETLSPTRVKLTVEIDFDELTPNVDSAYRKVAGQIRIPGFRPGKVPPRIVDQRVGRSVVLEEAVNEAIPQFYGKAVDEANVRVLSQPEIEVTHFGDGEQLSFTAEVDVRPEIELPAYVLQRALPPPRPRRWQWRPLPAVLPRIHYPRLPTCRFRCQRLRQRCPRWTMAGRAT